MVGCYVRTKLIALLKFHHFFSPRFLLSTLMSKTSRPFHSAIILSTASTLSSVRRVSLGKILLSLPSRDQRTRTSF